MFTQKPKPPPVVHRHDLTVKLSKVIEIEASGLGLIAAPVVLTIILLILVLTTFSTGQAVHSLAQRIGLIEAPAVEEKPPPK